MDALGILGVTRVVAIDPDPVHLAPAKHDRLPDDRHVVLGAARDHARAAADARAQVDRHPPLVALVLVAGPHRGKVLRLLVAGAGIAEEFSERRLVDDGPMLRELMPLHTGERGDASGLGDPHRDPAQADAAARRHREGEAVLADLVPDAARRGAAVPDRDRHDVLKPRLHVDGEIELRVPDVDGHDVRLHLIFGDAERLRAGRRDRDIVVPGDLRNRIGQFLKPSVVRVPAVVEGDRRVEHELERSVAFRRLRRGERLERLGAEGAHRRRRGALREDEDTFAEHSLPEELERRGRARFRVDVRAPAVFQVLVPASRGARERSLPQGPAPRQQRLLERAQVV